MYMIDFTRLKELDLWLNNFLHNQMLDFLHGPRLGPPKPLPWDEIDRRGQRKIGNAMARCINLEVDDVINAIVLDSSPEIKAAAAEFISDKIEMDRAW